MCENLGGLTNGILSFILTNNGKKLLRRTPVGRTAFRLEEAKWRSIMPL